MENPPDEALVFDFRLRGDRRSGGSGLGDNASSDFARRERVGRFCVAEASGRLFAGAERFADTLIVSPHSRHLIFRPISSSLIRASQPHPEHVTETANTIPSYTELCQRRATRLPQ